MIRFKEALQSGKFLVTAGICPPKGTHLEPFLTTLDGLAGKVDAVTFPDGRAARIHLSAVAAAFMAKNRGLEPILALSCRDRNRIALSSDLLGAHSLGLHNLLCVTGDYLTFGDAVEAKPVYDLDSVQLIQMIRELEKGVDIGGNGLDGAPAFCVGCVANPQAVPLEPQLLKLEKKLRAGAEFILTLDLFDMDRSTAFFERLKGKGVKVLAGIRLVTERDMALSDQGRLPGNPLPEEMKEGLKAIGERDKIIESARGQMVDLIKRLKGSGLCHGIHLHAEGYEDLLPQIIQEAGI
ncbi:MAG: methylenetetrahydrofolate reductase [Pseudomonadota bacterium]